ncbi:multidrug resistance transporter [Jeongeupia sp. HS-3]|uniref:efflux transporter outer membrane subunit n=1 Tax=Jeongeupia sp. HS-3 TaxID=1009682 RepID=UPI0018A45ECF|nr:efflux transporter outer membrane subunit [Jeongeupia sp. HS-3]BCL74912.1 multidrug resistance transporter [Jeongeupia sp. HS-3]
MTHTAPLLRRAVLLPIACALALLGSGCAMIRNDSAPMAQIDTQQIRLADDIKLARDGWPQAQWWQRYNDAQLNALIAQALKDAPSMTIAKARVDTAGAQAAFADANTGLLVGATASLNRQSVSENGYLGPFAQNAPALGLTGPWYTEGTIGIVASYSFDFWGKERAQVDAALGVQNAKLAEAAQAELVLSSQVTQIYYDIQALNATLALLRQASAIETEMVAAHTARADRGLESRTMVELVRVHKLELDKQIAGTDNKVRVLSETLRMLVGAKSGDAFTIKPAPLPASAGEMPTSLGYDLLARRPDLQAMRWYVQASLDGVDAARAAFYPSFDIKGFLGLDALHLADLLHKSSRQINLVPGLTLPLFDSGRLNANLKTVRANSDVTIAQYNAAVTNAVREVAQAGIELQGLQQQAEIQNAKLKATTFAADSAAAHYERGLADRVAAMEARLPLLFEQGQQLALRSKQINTEIALTASLGGGYQASNDPQRTASAK